MYERIKIVWLDGVIGHQYKRPAACTRLMNNAEAQHDNHQFQPQAMTPQYRFFISYVRPVWTPARGR